MGALTFIVLILIVYGLRNLQLKRTVDLEGVGKRVNFKTHFEQYQKLAGQWFFLAAMHF